MAELNAALMTAIGPHYSGTRAVNQARIINAAGAILAQTLAEFEINPSLRAAHFLAQTCHESDGFLTTVEYADGSAYEGRRDLGNTQPGDGPRYKGRGLIQLTGRANYELYGKLLGIDLITSPNTAADPATSLKLSCQFWTQNKLNALADQDNIVAITRKINGGLNGLGSRTQYLALAKAALGLAPSVRPLLHRGDEGEDVKALQQALTRAGDPVGVDGTFGSGTEAAVIKFQQANNLTADGIVGTETWRKLAG
jgi:putative chitinase